MLYVGANDFAGDFLADGEHALRFGVSPEGRAHRREVVVHGLLSVHLMGLVVLEHVALNLERETGIGHVIVSEPKIDFPFVHPARVHDLLRVLRALRDVTLVRRQRVVLHVSSLADIFWKYLSREPCPVEALREHSLFEF